MLTSELLFNDVLLVEVVFHAVVFPAVVLVVLIVLIMFIFASVAYVMPDIRSSLIIFDITVGGDRVPLKDVRTCDLE